MKYKKKPVVVEAIQYDGTDDSYNEGLCFTNGDLLWHKELKCPIIETLEGNMTVNIGDYIIKGVQGEFYPCKPDIFEKTYEVYEEQDVTNALNEYLRCRSIEARDVRDVLKARDIRDIPEYGLPGFWENEYNK